MIVLDQKLFCTKFSFEPTTFLLKTKCNPKFLTKPELLAVNNLTSFQHKCSNKTKTIIMDFDTIEINQVFLHFHPTLIYYMLPDTLYVIVAN